MKVLGSNGLYTITIIFGAAILFLAAAMKNLFSVLKVNYVEKLENNQDMIDFIHKNDFSKIYYGLSVDLAKMVEKYEYFSSVKVNFLNKAFSQIILGGSILILTALLITCKNLF